MTYEQLQAENRALSEKYRALLTEYCNMLKSKNKTIESLTNLVDSLMGNTKTNYTERKGLSLLSRQSKTDTKPEKQQKRGRLVKIY